MCEVSAKYGFCDWGIPHCKKCGDHINEGSERNDICNNCKLELLDNYVDRVNYRISNLER